MTGNKYQRCSLTCDAMARQSPIQCRFLRVYCLIVTNARGKLKRLVLHKIKISHIHRLAQTTAARHDLPEATAAPLPHRFVRLTPLRLLLSNSFFLRYSFQLLTNVEKYTFINTKTYLARIYNLNHITDTQTRTKPGHQIHKKSWCVPVNEAYWRNER